jgi:hypothetical protein
MLNSEWHMSFIEAYCTKFKCSHEAFQDHLFWSSFSWAYPFKLFAKCFKYFNQEYFNEDFIAINRIGATYNETLFQHEIDDFYYILHVRGTIVRRFFGLRISLKRIIFIKRLIFNQ